MLKQGLDRDPSSAEPLGLELKPVKVPTETLIIDHVERPSEN
jgi:uncharacterized protein (TIGR03435 family)